MENYIAGKEEWYLGSSAVKRKKFKSSIEPLAAVSPSSPNLPKTPCKSGSSRERHIAHMSKYPTPPTVVLTRIRHRCEPKRPHMVRAGNTWFCVKSGKPCSSTKRNSSVPVGTSPNKSNSTWSASPSYKSQSSARGEAESSKWNTPSHDPSYPTSDPPENPGSERKTYAKATAKLARHRWLHRKSGIWTKMPNCSCEHT